MSNFEKAEINGKTVWLPVQQEAMPLPPKATPKPKAPYAKHVGRRLGERKRWY